MKRTRLLNQSCGSRFNQEGTAERSATGFEPQGRVKSRSSILLPSAKNSRGEKEMCQHLRDQGLSYTQHFRQALFFSMVCIRAAGKLLLHALCPWWFEETVDHLLYQIRSLKEVRTSCIEKELEMPRTQPDFRIRLGDLGIFILGGRRYVTHDQRGCPRNAVVENYQGNLRCWACHMPLNEEAAQYVRKNAHPKDEPKGEKNYDAFVWNDNFYHHRPIRNRNENRS